MAANNSAFNSGAGRSPFKGKVGDANLSAEDFNNLSPEDQKRHVNILSGAAKASPENDASEADIAGAQEFLKGKGYQGKVRVRTLPGGQVSAKGKRPATVASVKGQIKRAVDTAAGLPTIPEPTYGGEKLDTQRKYNEFLKQFEGVSDASLAQARTSGLFRKHTTDEAGEEKLYRAASSRRNAGLGKDYDPNDQKIQALARAAYTKVKPAKEDSLADPTSATPATGFLHPKVPVLSRDYFNDFHKLIDVVDTHLDESAPTAQRAISNHLLAARESLNSAMAAHQNGHIFDEDVNYDTSNIRGRGKDSQSKIASAKKGSLSHMADAYAHLFKASNATHNAHPTYKANSGHLAVATLAKVATEGYSKEAALSDTDKPRNVDRSSVQELAEGEQKLSEYNLTRARFRKGTSVTSTETPYVTEENEGKGSTVRFGLGAKAGYPMSSGHTPVAPLDENNLPADEVARRIAVAARKTREAEPTSDADRRLTAVGMRPSPYQATPEEPREARNTRLEAAADAATAKAQVFASAEEGRRVANDADLSRKADLYERLGHFDKAAQTRGLLSTYKPTNPTTQGMRGSISGTKALTEFGAPEMSPKEESTVAAQNVAQAHWHSTNTPEGGELHTKLKALDAEQAQGIATIQQKYGSLPRVEGTTPSKMKNLDTIDWDHPDTRAYLSELNTHNTGFESKRKALYGSSLVKSYKAMDANPEGYLAKNRIAIPGKLEKIPNIAQKANLASGEKPLQFGTGINKPRPPQ
jgi:hypothetical protein